jgi:Ca-activated chloride channel family protein
VSTIKTGCRIVFAVVLLTGGVRAQSVRSLVNGGNGLYKDGNYTDAEVKYRKALEKERGLPAGKFNLGDALYKQGKYDESLREYEDVASTQESPAIRAGAFYNHGNALMKAEKYQEALQSYIEALKLKPDDQDAKYNLSYALEKLRQQQQQQQQNKDDKKQQNKDQQKQQDQKNQQDQKKNQQEQQQKQDQQQQQQQQQDQQQMARQEKRMSKQDAERILEVLKNSERDVQKKLRVRQATRAKTDKDW